MRRATLLVLALGWAGLTAADAQPAADAPAEADSPSPSGVALHLIDLDRSRTRWADSPYPALLQTRWGHWMQEQVAALVASEWNLDAEILAEAGASQRQITAGLVRDPDDPHAAPLIVVTGVGDLDDVVPLLGDTAIAAGMEPTPVWLTSTGDLIARPDGWLWRQTRLAQAFTSVPTIPAAPADASEAADVMLTIAPGAVDDFNRFVDEDDAGGAEPTGQRIVLTLDPLGLREQQLQQLSPERALRLLTRSPPPAPRAALLALPADTLWAFSLGWDATALWTWTEVDMDADQLATLEKAIAPLGIGSVGDICRDLRDDVQVWCRAAAPFPTLWLDAGCTEARARLLLGALRDHAGFTVTDELTGTGAAGPLPLQVAWKDGRFRATTDPFGFVDAAPATTFGDVPAIQAASAHWHPDAFFIAASRSDASWRAVGGLVQLAVLAQGHQDFATLATDLAQAGHYGYASGDVTAEGHVRIDAGGLFGGPIGWILSGVGGALVYYQLQMAELAEPVPLPE